LTKKEITNLIDGLSPLRSERNGHFLRPHDEARLPHACIAGISFGKDDLIIPEAKQKLVPKRTKKSKSSNSSIRTV
jgi:DNA-directed RNA polymerase subunit beta'